ncbi:MAG: hypothetical protein ACO3PB_00260, partial [Miltoncostaeaceae bacterium]
AFAHADAPLFLFHLLEFSGAEFDLDIDELNARWADPENIDSWSQLVIKHTDDSVDLVSAAPESGIWRMRDDGTIEYDRFDYHRRAIESDREAFYLRIIGPGDYRYEGADLGILVMRGPGHVRDQLTRTEEAVADAAGTGVLTHVFRAPHGFRGPATWAAVRSAGYRMAGWTKGVFDSADPGPDVVAARSARALAPGCILLLHDADGWDPDRPRTHTVAAIPDICASAREKGLELVTLDELLA